jgi:protoporphyrinogen oxidase
VNDVSSPLRPRPLSGAASAADDPSQVVVIGAGPAGLTAALQLVRRGVGTTVLEADDVVGGISRTVERDGWRFDIGGHRFFTKVQEVEAMWHELLGPDELLRRPRMSRIFYDGKFYDYPLKASTALKNLGLVESVRCVGSYAWARVRPPEDTSTFEGWVASRFGWRLYRTFFKTYTEKVWGVPATSIQADWAAQRIKNLSLGSAIANALLPRRNGTQITSLIEEFLYPKYGPGMMWEACRDRVVAAGGEVRLEAPVMAIERDGERAVRVRSAGTDEAWECDAVVSTMPLGKLVESITPAAPADVLEAARGLKHRDFLTVALVVPEDTAFPDNWIYVHSPDVRLGRVQNFGAWSPWMVKPGYTCLGLEYFVNEGDDLWTMADDDLIAFATAELEQIGLVDAGAVQQGFAVRIPKAYPVYDADYAARVDILRAWLADEVTNVHPVGRNGMHRYNNQDHSMYAAMLAVENIVDGAAHDVWDVNVDDDYHEEDQRTSRSSAPVGTGRMAPVIG